jgi:hypothetical protein
MIVSPLTKGLPYNMLTSQEPNLGGKLRYKIMDSADFCFSDFVAQEGLISRKYKWKILSLFWTQ